MFMKKVILAFLLFCIITLYGCNYKLNNIKEIVNIKETSNNEVIRGALNDVDKNNNDKTLLELNNIKETLEKEIKIGDKVKYGVMAYESYAHDYIAPMMDWLVLDKDDKKVLLISDKIILSSDYDSLKSTIEGAYSYIFSDFEREGILLIDENKGKVFSPTKEIYDKYFGKMDIKGMNEKAISIATKAAKNKGLDVSSNNDLGYFGSGSYWLSDEVGNDKVMWVGEYGHIYEAGDDKKNLHGIRFCMYVDINHLVYDKIFNFGSYEQDNNIENGKEPILWKALEIKNDKILLMSDKILFCSIYDDRIGKWSYEKDTYEEDREFYYRDSVLRKSLVEDFYSEAFDKMEQNILCEHKYSLPKNYNIRLQYGDDRQETEEFTDKVFLIDQKFFKRYYDAEEPYAPPENVRFDVKITPYALSSKEKGYNPDDLFSAYIFNDKNTFYWLLDLDWRSVGGEYQVVGTVKNADNKWYNPRLNFRYGVRPFIEIDLKKVHQIVAENEQKILQLNEEKNKNIENNINKNNIVSNENLNILWSDDVILGDKYINTLASINNILEEKYNLNLDAYYYDIDETKKEISIKVNSTSNEYKGILTFAYEDDKDGYILKEELVKQTDICDIRGVESSNIDKYITLRDYELTILRLFNMNTKPIYEKLPIKKNLIEKVNKQTEGIFNKDFSYSMKANIIDRDKNADTLFGIDGINPIDGENELEIDVVSGEKVSRYKVITNIKYIDDKSYYIDDIEINFVKSFNKPGDIEKPKEFLKTESNYKKTMTLTEIMRIKKANDTKEKKVTTYKELVDKALGKYDENTNKYLIDSITPVKKGQNSNDNYYYEFSLDKIKFDVMKFGKYKGAPIEWYILADENGQKLLISKYIIDNKCFSDNNMCYSWENSTIRKWLNEDFYNEAFSNVEKKKISNITTKCKNSKQNEYDVIDKVFLLNEKEYEKFFGGFTNAHINSYGMAEATEYAKNVKNGGKKLFVETKSDEYDLYSYGFSNYWLRDFSNGDNVKNVSPIGQVLSENFYEKEKSGVRPCILIGNRKIEDKNNKQIEKDKLENQKEIPDYKYMLTLGDTDLYMDVRTNIFTFENDVRINLGRINEDSLWTYELQELDEIFHNSYYFDEKNEKLYFKDWSEKFVEGYDYNNNYNSLVEIDKNINKTKIAEKVYEFVVLKDNIIYAYNNKYDVFSYKNGIENKLNIGNHLYFIFGHHGDDICYVKERTFNTNNIYKIENEKATKVTELPKEYK